MHSVFPPLDNANPLQEKPFSFINQTRKLRILVWGRTTQTTQKPVEPVLTFLVFGTPKKDPGFKVSQIQIFFDFVTLKIDIMMPKGLIYDFD